MASSASRARSNRRASLIANSRLRSKDRQPPIMWNIQGMRGQMSSNCLWHACKALFVGIVLFLAGVAMCVFGFHSDGLFDARNSTDADRFVNHADPSRPSAKFSKLSYIGPIVMGVGGFIIVATCVMTFEARDSAAKVGPAILGATSSSPSNVFPLACRSRVKNIDVRSVASQTHGSAMSLSTVHLFDKKLIMDTFRKFSRTLRSSTSISSSQVEQLHRSPSAPSLLNTAAPQQPHSSRSARTAPHASKSRVGRTPAAFRQTMSVDCSSIPVVPFMSNSLTASTQTFLTRPTSSSRPRAFYRNVSTASEGYVTGGDRFSGGLVTPPACSSSIPSDDSVLRSVQASVHHSNHGNQETVELHLPNGLVTLNVMRSFGGSGSSTSLRTLSPHPSCYSDDSFDRPCAKSESISKSPTPQKAVSFKTELSSCRPALIRQTKVDCSEVIYVQDSEDESTILEDNLGTIQELE